MSRTEIIKYKDNLLTNLVMLGEYDAAAGLRKPVLLVEGATDKKFIGHIQCNDTRCLSVADFMRVRNAFSTSSPQEPVNYNSKTVITTILKHISLFPELMDFPKGAERWPLYGLVDSDFDNRNDFARVTKLFFTDTHDLETLMMSTDGELFEKIKQCRITVDDIKRALYIANQLSAFRRAIKHDGKLNPAAISTPDGVVEYGEFTESDKIIPEKLLAHINNKADQPLPKERMKKTRDAISKDMKKQLDKNGVWKKSIDSFVIDDDSDFWMNINGHDILSAIRYINPGAREAFVNKGGYSQNREFELALTEVYDYSCLKTTEVYSKLQEAGFLRE